MIAPVAETEGSRAVGSFGAMVFILKSFRHKGKSTTRVQAPVMETDRVPIRTAEWRGKHWLVTDGL